MSNIFSYDNKFFSAISKIVDAICVSGLWLLFSIPIFTIGASTTALYDTVHKSFVREHGYIWETFWESFKNNFKQATKLWGVFFVIYAVLAVDIDVMFYALKANSPIGSMFYFFLIMAMFAFVWTIYTFAYCARFELNTKGILKNGGLLAIANLPWSFLILLILLVGIIVVYIVPITLLVMPVGVTSLFNVILEKVFRKIMSPEDLKAAKEDDWGIDK